MSTCIFAKGPKRDGYVINCEHSKHFSAHRKALEIKLCRPISKGMLALHTCHNRSCINPDHLYEGNQQDNMRDMVRAERSCRGSQKTFSKLTEEIVLVILVMLQKGTPIQEIADNFNVHKSQISRIKNNKAWKHVPRVVCRPNVSSTLTGGVIFSINQGVTI